MVWYSTSVQPLAVLSSVDQTYSPRRRGKLVELFHTNINQSFTVEVHSFVIVETTDQVPKVETSGSMRSYSMELSKHKVTPNFADF